MQSRIVMVLVAITGHLLIPNASVLGADTASGPYPLPTCAVSGEALDAHGDPVIEEVDGREFRFCTETCARKFSAGPEPYVAEIDQAIIDRQLAIYPLPTCIVSGKSLEGASEHAVNHLAGHRLVRFCSVVWGSPTTTSSPGGWCASVARAASGPSMAIPPRR